MRSEVKMNQTIPIEQIKADPRAQPRVEVDQFLVDEYADAMRQGGAFPPVMVFGDGEVFYRVAAEERRYAMTTARLERETFRTSRLLDFLSQKELIAQTGHRPEAWPLVVLKELVDNAIDACEDAGTPPRIHVQVDKTGITVTDNGPGIPAETVAGVLDF